MSQTSHIRNFCIIAHIDHGKSTLADRLLEITGTVEKRKLQAQQLDSMELEREKGITIKLKAVRMNYDLNGQKFQLNLIDTPGHVDFSYEVSRSLAACEGALLVVDASQGIEAQTVSNVYKALEAGLTIIPILNKIDLPGVEIEKVEEDLVHTFGFKKEEFLHVSAKTGEGVENLIEELIKRVSPPQSLNENSFRGLIFDTYYDDFLGVIALVKVADGKISQEDILKRRKLKFVATSGIAFPEEIGVMIPSRQKTQIIDTGEVGYIATGLKDIKLAKVGDTITFEDCGIVEPLPGYKEVKPLVFASIFTIDTARFPELREALGKLSLSDAALTYEPESSGALGFGFRCGFLGLLHSEIVQERLEREYNLELISTTPMVEYKIELTDGSTTYVKSAAEFPLVTKIEQIFEPWVLLNIVTPATYTGSIISLCENNRGIMKKMEYASSTRVIFEYELPLSGIIHNFYDDLKSISSGYASLDYEFIGYRPVNAVKMDILVHGDEVPALAQVVLKETAHEEGKRILHKLKTLIPKQQFKVSLQAAINGKIIAREDISSVGKSVLAGISGGHRERKDKLIDRQKKGKERLKMVGKVAIPQEAFREVLKN
jgi:GTP-binding protein LepA